MLFLKQPFILPFLCRKSATTCWIDSYEVLNSKLKPDLCNCLETEIIESTVSPQQPHKRGTIPFGHLVCSYNIFSISSCLLLESWANTARCLDSDKVHETELVLF